VLALLVDDCHWVDGPSLRFLAHLSARLEGLPAFLRDALARIDTPSNRAAAALRAGRALGAGGHYREAAAILESIPDPDLRIQAELAASGLQLASHASSALALLARRRDARPTDGAGWPLMQVMLAHRSVIAAEHHSVAQAFLDRALAGQGLFGQESLITVYAAMDLVLIDRLDDAEQLCSMLNKEGRRRGSLSIISSFAFAWAFASLRRGRLRDAEAHGQLALDGMLRLVPRSNAGAPWALAFLVDALTERGDTAGADEALARVGPPAADPPEMLAWAFLLTAQGRLRIAQGDLREGLADLREAGARWERLNCRTPTTRWREDAAHGCRRCATSRSRDAASCSPATSSPAAATSHDIPNALAQAPDDVVSSGGSCVIGPLGEVLAGPARAGEEILFADIDLDEIARGKFDFDVAGHYARPDVFQLIVDEAPKPPVSPAQ
jgi:tetratricopeptide (TPR) repeat protein